MNRAEDFARVESIFAQLTELPAGQRAAMLDRLCAEHPEIRTDVETLLAAHDQLTPCAESAAAAPADARFVPGGALGPYRLIEKVGEGGMGDVYRAARADGAFDRDVAIKVMRAAFAGSDALRRFTRERQILASLDHPNVVRLLDAGITPENAAYFVMEFVDGVPITEYCSSHRLGLAARLGLFRRVCSAVQHAHQHAVVHRDLKPGNVLVTADRVVKVLDFGVARLVAEQVEHGRTVGVLPAPLTPNYASPEQLRGTSITTASDVYALGVLLYEIVVGRRPYETRGAPLDRVLQIVNETDPPWPSVALGDQILGSPPYTGRRLRGDIDAIVMKALRKEPAERYSSPAELGADLDRVASRRPVTARPPSPLYLLRRFAARNRALVSVLLLAGVGILSALGVAVWQWREARSQQIKAEHRFSELRQLANKVLFDYEDTLRRLRGATELRARMAADSLIYLDGLAAERSDDVALLLDVARGYLRIAAVQGNTRSGNIGDSDGAMRSLERAATLLDDLADRQPDLVAVHELRAQVGCVAARIDTARAAEHARRCIDALEQLKPGRAATDPLVLLLGDAYTLLAEAGEVAYAERAVAIFQPVVDDPGTRRRARLSLALTYRLIGWEKLRAGAAAEALAAGEAGLAAMAPIVAIDAQATRMEYSFTLLLVGRSHLVLKDVDRGRPVLLQAVDQMRQAVEANPGDAFLQDRVSFVYADAARALEPDDRATAARLYREAVALLPSLTRAMASPHRERVRGSLYAGHARLNLNPPPCDLLRRADAQFAAAERSAALEDPPADDVTWVRKALMACASDSTGSTGAAPAVR
jgi:serine/threonine protein kinase